MQGTVKWFNDVKGYGFVVSESGEDIFVHFSSILANGYKTLKEGAEVVFDIGENDKGKIAINVTVIAG